MKCCIDSLYICVEDMERAVRFYEDFFEMKVSERGGTVSCFEIAAFRFNLFACNAVGEKHTFGSNCLPSIHFDSLDSMDRKLSGKEICFPLTKIGRNWVAEFVDSEGNHIEVYTAAV